MKLIKKLFFLFVIPLVVWGGIYLYNQKTDGFSLYQMTSSLPPYPQFEESLSQKQKKQLQEFLSQPFYYLGKGCQFYAFASEDGKYVLKFLKHKHLRPFFWLRSIPMPRKLKKISDAKTKRRLKRVENLFSSCQLAYRSLKEETGLLFIHLNRVPALEKEVVVYDKLGFKHCIELDQYEYIIQKKAITVKEAFVEVNTKKELCLRIEQLIEVVKARCEKGIANHDRSFVQNVAFCVTEPRALLIDTGQFYEDSQICTQEAQNEEFRKRLGHLREWSECHFPHFSSTIDEYLTILTGF